jgi:hypothetical protein
MITWGDLRRLRPEIADGGRALLYQHGLPLAYLATVRPDGLPRLHRRSPIIHQEGLYVFIRPSPTQRDLLRDGRYAISTYPTPSNEDAFSVVGRAEAREDAALREAVERTFFSDRKLAYSPWPRDWRLFELFVDSALLTRTKGWGDPNPVHHSFRAPREERGDGAARAEP